MISGERADEPVRELSVEDGLQALSWARGRFDLFGDAGAVIEQAVGGLAIRGRRCVHGSLVIGDRRGGSHPWRE